MTRKRLNLFSVNQANDVLDALSTGLPRDFDLIQAIQETRWPTDTEGYKREMECRRDLFIKMLALHADKPRLDQAAGVSVFQSDLLEACVLITKGQCSLPKVTTRIVRECLEDEQIARHLKTIWADVTHVRDYKEYMKLDDDDYTGSALLIDLPILDEAPTSALSQVGGDEPVVPQPQVRTLRRRRSTMIYLIAVHSSMQ